MKWYKAKLHSPYIEEVEVLRETESCVFIQSGKGERKCLKICDYGSYFNDRKSAEQWILSKYLNEVDKAKRNLIYREKNYDKVEQDLKNIID